MGKLFEWPSIRLSSNQLLQLMTDVMTHCCSLMLPDNVQLHHTGILVTCHSLIAQSVSKITPQYRTRYSRPGKQVVPYICRLQERKILIQRG